MRVIIETRTGKRWGFDSLKLAKECFLEAKQNKKKR